MMICMSCDLRANMHHTRIGASYLQPSDMGRLNNVTMKGALLSSLVLLLTVPIAVPQATPPVATQLKNRLPTHDTNPAIPSAVSPPVLGNVTVNRPPIQLLSTSIAEVSVRQSEGDV